MTDLFKGLDVGKYMIIEEDNKAFLIVRLYRGENIK